MLTCRTIPKIQEENILPPVAQVKVRVVVPGVREEELLDREEELAAVAEEPPRLLLEVLEEGRFRTARSHEKHLPASGVRSPATPFISVTN